MLLKLTADSFITKKNLSKKEKEKIIESKKQLVKFYNKQMISDEDKNEGYIKEEKKSLKEEEDEDY
jgi:hypothetical protein